MSPPPIVSLRGVGHAFGSSRVLDGASLGLGRGDRVCLVGRNGSGKSTLMRILSGRLEPDAGDRFVQPGMRLAWLEPRSEEHTSELQSLMRLSYAVFCLKKQTEQYH